MIRVDYTVDGEIISAHKKTNDLGADIILYRCRVTLSDGTPLMVDNAEDASMYGGISDYSRRLARTRSDSDYKSKTVMADDLNSSVGEEVYISFLHGNILRPIIIAYKQHYKQIDEPELQDKLKKVTQYLGIREERYENGDYRIIHKGAPEISYKPQTTAPDAEFPGDKSAAVKPAKPEERTIVELLSGGTYRVRDFQGGVIELNHLTKKGILLSTNDVKSTDKEDKTLLKYPSPTDAEFLYLNRDSKTLALGARSLIDIHAYKDRKDTTDGNFNEIVKGKLTSNITGDSENTVGGKYKLQASGESKLSIGEGKVALGAKGVEIFDNVIKTLKQIQEYLKAAATHTHIGNMGYPTAPPDKAAQYSSIEQSIKKIESDLASVKGKL